MEKDVYECEVKILHTDDSGDRVFGWMTMSVLKAYQLRDTLARCKECHGRVKLMCAGPNGVPQAHPEHYARNRGCSLGDCFDGTARMHVNAIN